MGRQYLLYLLLAALFPTLSPAQVHHFAQAHSSEQVEVSPPPVRRAEPPPADAAVAELEARGDTLRSEKFYLDALDYYRAALKKEPDSARLYNKTGINELQMARFGEASKDFRTGHQERPPVCRRLQQSGRNLLPAKEIRKGHQGVRKGDQDSAGFRLILQ